MRKPHLASVERWGNSGTVRARRRGAALPVAVVALAVVSVVAVIITSHVLTGRRLLDQRQRQLQAEWLARAGVELAAARLLTDPTGYEGETVELIPGSQVRIEVLAEPGAPDGFHVTSEARFPKEGPNVVLRSVTRSLRRTKQGDQVRIEVGSKPTTVPRSGDPSADP